jgi:hypothetical protein
LEKNGRKQSTVSKGPNYMNFKIIEAVFEIRFSGVSFESIY